jgi:hypothetical protein
LREERRRKKCTPNIGADIVAITGILLRGGMRRKSRNPETKRRERDFSGVDCPTQQKTYCKTYHKIDKGNGAEAKYDIATESHLHGWGPKLAARFSI